jgi:hypothetical protein
MTIIVGETERAELQAAMLRARAHPVPWEELKNRTAAREGTKTQHIGDLHERSSAEFVNLPFGYVVAITFEEQPAGMCLHISVSGPWPRVPPNTMVCAMVFSALDLAPEADDVWTEELPIEDSQGGRAFNAVWVVEPAIT